MRRALRRAQRQRSPAEEIESVSCETVDEGYRKNYHAFFRNRATQTPRSPHMRSHSFRPQQRGKSLKAEFFLRAQFRFPAPEPEEQTTSAPRRRSAARWRTHLASSVHSTCL